MAEGFTPPHMEPPIWQTLFNVVASSLASVGLWLMSRMSKRIDDLETKLHDHRVEVARDYVTNADLIERLNEIKDAVHRIDEKLDRKGPAQH